MHKLIENATKELKEIEKVGLNATNLDNAFKLSSIYSKLKKTAEMEEETMRGMYNDGRGGYRDGGNSGGYSNYNGYGREGYGRRGVPGSGRGGYRGEGRWSEYLDRVMDSAEMYQYGRSRYRDGDDDGERMIDGLEKMMYAICTFVEATMDFAESPEEKEIVRKHIQKLQKM